MKPLLPLAVLLAVGIAGCSKSDPYAKYRDAQLKRGMKIAEIIQQLGQPDHYRDWWDDDPNNPIWESYTDQWQLSPECPYHVEELDYGAFGAHSQRSGHVTKHRLTMTFVDGELYTWRKSAPINGE